MNSTAQTADVQTDDARIPPKELKKVVLASVMGNLLEWYDFFLYSTAAALVFNKVFFPADLDPLLGTLGSFAGFAVGFIARPFGGVIFGHIGDKHGRKRALVWTLMLMGVATFCIGLLPNYEQIGLLAPVLLVVLRILQGFAAGGEWGGGVLIVSENAPPKRRGFFSSFSQVGVAGGFVLSAGVFYLAQLMPQEQFISWGWRIPFLLSVLVFAMGMYIRTNLSESAEFVATQAQKKTVHLPIVEVVRTQPKEVLLAMGLRVAENGSSYIFLAFTLAYGRFIGISQDLLLLGVMLSMILDAIFMVFFGLLSDKIGRRPVYSLGAGGLVVIAIPFFLMINTGEPAWVLAAFILGNSICHAAMIGTMPAYFTELFKPEVRYSGVALGHGLSSVFAGGLSPLIATALLAHFQSFLPVALYLMVLGLITLLTLFWARSLEKARAISL